MIKKKKVVILGAGLAGLACADEILRKGKDKFEVMVLEKNPFIGGLAATFKKDGFLFDLAPHRWFTKNDELNKWIDELMGKEMIWVKKYTPMYQFGKFFNYPIEVLDMLKKLDLIKMALMLSTYAWVRVSNKIFKKKIITMKDAYINRFGSALYKWFNEEFNEKLWGKGGCETMSADFVAQRTRDLSISTIMKNALGLGGTVVSLTPKFRFPKLGIGRIAENLKARILKNGGVIKTKINVEKIIKNKSGYQIFTNQGNFKADYLVSSIPIDVLANLFQPFASAEIVEATGKLNYISQKIVVLLAKKPRLTNFTWVYVHPPQIKFFRFLETNNWSAVMSPKGKTSLTFEYPYQPGASNWIEKVNDKQLIKNTIGQFVEYFSPQTKKADIFKSLVIKVDRAYPKYDLCYRQPLEKIKTYLRANHPQIQLIGRNGMFRYNNMDHSVYTGLLAARNIVNGKLLYNTDNVNEEAEYLEEKQL